MAHCASTLSLARVLVNVHVLNVRCPYWRCAGSGVGGSKCSKAGPVAKGRQEARVFDRILD
jgi:hypothetical protein